MTFDGKYAKRSLQLHMVRHVNEAAREAKASKARQAKPERAKPERSPVVATHKTNGHAAAEAPPPEAPPARKQISHLADAIDESNRQLSAVRERLEEMAQLAAEEKRLAAEVQILTEAAERCAAVDAPVITGYADSTLEASGTSVPGTSAPTELVAANAREDVTKRRHAMGLRPRD